MKPHNHADEDEFSLIVSWTVEVRVGDRVPPEYYQLAEEYGIAIQDDWIEDIERTYSVKL